MTFFGTVHNWVTVSPAGLPARCPSGAAGRLRPRRGRAFPLARPETNGSAQGLAELGLGEDRFPTPRTPPGFVAAAHVGERKDRGGRGGPAWALGKFVPLALPPPPPAWSQERARRPWRRPPPPAGCNQPPRYAAPCYPGPVCFEPGPFFLPLL